MQLEHLIKKAHIAEINAIDDYVVLIFLDNSSMLLTIEINDMFFDGISVFNQSNISSIHYSFKAKPVYEYAKHSCISDLNIDLLAEIQSKMCHFKDVLNFLCENKVFVGIDSIFENNTVLDIGYINNIEDDKIFLTCVNVDGTVDDLPYVIKIKDVIKVEFKSRYLEVYQNYVSKN